MAKNCKRCDSLYVRLDELNRNFNALWDYLVEIGEDPDGIIDEAEFGSVVEITDKGSRRIK